MRTMNVNGVPSYVVAKKEEDDEELVIYRVDSGAIAIRKPNFENPEILWESEYLVIKQNGNFIHLSKSQLIDLLNILA